MIAECTKGKQGINDKRVSNSFKKKLNYECVLKNKTLPRREREKQRT